MADFILHTNIFLLFALGLAFMVSLGYALCIMVAMAKSYQPYYQESWNEHVNKTFISLLVDE